MNSHSPARVAVVDGYAKIGILSDSHGRVQTTRRAVAALKALGADVLLHLGDVGREAVLEELLGCDARVVWGNCDDDLASMARYAAILGVNVCHPIGTIESGGRRIAFTHGHLPELMDQALSSGVDYLLHGHTHEVRDERVGQTRVINPGALFRAARYTAAMLLPHADALQIIEIPRS